MPVTAVSITQAIIAAGSSSMKGPHLAQIATGVGNAVFAWMSSPTNLSLTGVTTGQAGAGTVTGLLSVPPAIPLVIQNLQGAGIKGPNATPLGTALSMGIATAFSVASYIGISLGVAIGTDKSTVSVSNAATLIPIMLGNLGVSMKGSGLSIGMLSIGISNGIASQLQLGQGFGVVVGTPTPIPATVVGTSPLSKVF